MTQKDDTSANNYCSESPATFITAPSTTRAPSPPRWRFVNEAKSTLGYSSLSAGQIVNGRSADELAAKYLPPDIEASKTQKLQHHVGKLVIIEEERREETLPVGTFPGFPRTQDLKLKEKRKFREWENINESNSSVIDSQQSVTVEPRSQAGDQLNLNSPPIVAFAVANLCYEQDIRPKHVSMNGGSEKQLELDKYETVKAPQLVAASYDSLDSLFVEVHHQGMHLSSFETIKPQTYTGDFYKKPKKQLCLYILLLLLLLLVIILSALLGKISKRSTNLTASSAVATFIVSNVTVAPSIVISAYPSASPTEIYTMIPSLAPTQTCPVGTKYFSLELPLQRPLSQYTHNVTWELRYACSGDVIVECLPCSPGTFLFGSHNNIRQLKQVFQNVSACIPSDTEYMFESHATEDSELCCGFDIFSAIIRFDNVLYSVRHDDTLFPSVDDFHIKTYFGKSDAPCATATPIELPSTSPSVEPSITPSELPISLPTLAPSSLPRLFPSNLPLQSSIIFVGGCPEKILPMSQYSFGTLIDSDGIVYQCIDFLCESYDFVLGQDDSTLWSQGWEMVGTCEVKSTSSLTPTNLMVTTSPTEAPTVSCRIESDFNLCIAIDNSGSICNFLTGECLGCFPSLLCQSLFVPKDTCCYNFGDIRQFSKQIITSLDELKVKKSFSIVQFATNAELIADLVPGDEALNVLEEWTYTGGDSNHAEGIELCQRSIGQNYDQSRKNFIMLITDGIPSSDDFDPEVEAEKAATDAKNAGTVIIPIFISKWFDADAFSFMARLSSDGDVFDVKDFGSLDSLKDQLIDQVSCS